MMIKKNATIIATSAAWSGTRARRRRAAAPRTIVQRTALRCPTSTSSNGSLTLTCCSSGHGGRRALARTAVGIENVRYFIGVPGAVRRAFPPRLPRSVASRCGRRGRLRTATSLAAERIAGAVPPARPACVGEVEATEGRAVGHLEGRGSRASPSRWRRTASGSRFGRRERRARSAGACRASRAARSSRRRRTRPCCAPLTAGVPRRRSGRTRHRTARAPR